MISTTCAGASRRYGERLARSGSHSRTSSGICVERPAASGVSASAPGMSVLKRAIALAKNELAPVRLVYASTRAWTPALREDAGLIA